MVDVGGYRLHINCTGSGSPTVVMDAGLGAWSTVWDAVQAEVSKTTRVCSYDRAGMGWSDPGPLPRDAAQFSRELQALLRAADVPGPYVMVGHSLGGLPVLVFVHEHASDVKGVVLVESMQPGQLHYATQSQAFSVFSVLARFGIVRLLARPLDLVEHDPLNEGALLARSVRPQSLQAYGAEIQGIPASLKEASAVTTFGDLPLIVLSRGLDPDPAWQAGQLRLTTLSTNSQQLIAVHSDHGIPSHQPEAAVDAILKMVKQVRGQ
jgi:pimeloyl-ACP methyl ester carboxylesterase